LAEPVQEQHTGPWLGRRVDDIRLDPLRARLEDDVADPGSLTAGHRSSIITAMAIDVPPIRLTELTGCGGCAAKRGADVLEEALAGLGATDAAPAGLIAGLDPPDDAAVHLVAPDVAVIGTLDFFPPIVDDPRTYGEIAAANALSDVFAMGG